MTGALLGNAARPLFARHQTFPPRTGWLHKGFDAADADPAVFRKPEAVIALGGVGKNMAASIRYWLTAFGLAEERPAGAGQRGHDVVPTWEASWLLSEHGADPYLEDPASLWMLHWRLLSPPCNAPTWWVAFNSRPTPRLPEEGLAALVNREAKKSGWAAPPPDSVARDISCLTRMYGDGQPAGSSREDVLDLINCPFRELRLLTDNSRAGHREWWIEGNTSLSLPAEVIVYACLDYVSRTAAGPGSVTVSRLAAEPGSPGRAFVLSQDRIAEALQQAARSFPQISLTHSPAGRSLVFSRPPQEAAWDILDSYYDGARARVPTRAQWASRHAAPVRTRPRMRGARGPGHGALPLFGLPPRPGLGH